MALSLIAAAVLLLAPAPARAIGVDVREEALSFLNQRALLKGNVEAGNAAKFLRSRPEIKLVLATPAELADPRYELLMGAYDFKYDTIFLVENAKEGLAVRDAQGRVPKEAFERFMSARGSALVHEASHAYVAKTLRLPVAGVIHDELLAHVRQARYLEKEPKPSAAVLKAADNYRRMLFLSDAGGAEVLESLKERHELEKAELGLGNIHQALLLTQYRLGPRALARYLRARYGPAKGYWSVFGRPDPPIARLQGQLEDPNTSETSKESAVIQIAFWSDDARLSAARKFYAKQLPEYRDLRWPDQE